MVGKPHVMMWMSKAFVLLQKKFSPKKHRERTASEGGAASHGAQLLGLLDSEVNAREVQIPSPPNPNPTHPAKSGRLAAE